MFTTATLNMTPRFWSKITFTPYCWLWGGALNRDGYGIHISYSKRVRVHQLIREQYNGPKPAGYQLDHRCRNRSCVNPQHLRLVTNKQNSENQGLHPSNKSGYRGVHWYKRTNQWRAQVKHNQKVITVGYFDDVEEAAEAARLKRLELFTHNEEDQRLTR